METEPGRDEVESIVNQPAELALAPGAADEAHGPLLGQDRQQHASRQHRLEVAGSVSLDRRITNEAPPGAPVGPGSHLAVDLPGLTGGEPPTKAATRSTGETGRFPTREP